MRILFIINPVSGRTSNDKAILRIHDLAVKQHFDFKFHYTTGENDDETIQQQLKDYKPDRVIAGGGDGTLQLVSRNLMGQKIPLGMLPLGSANGMVTAMGFPQQIDAALDLAVNADHTIPLDLLKFNGEHLCMHLGDIGINALMVKKYGESDKRGMVAYAKHLMSSIKESPLLNYKITTPEGTFDKEGYMLAFANAHKYGTGVHISEGDVWDGKFEICNVPKVALEDAIKAGLTMLNVFIDKNMFSDVISCPWAEISIDQPVDFQIDGEYMGKTDFLRVEVIPSALKLLVP